MTPKLSNSHKNTAFKLSEQVKATLHEKGFSFLFNYSDFKYYKDHAKAAFNKAQVIADLFIEDNTTQKSDYNGYIF